MDARVQCHANKVVTRLKIAHGILRLQGEHSQTAEGDMASSDCRGVMRSSSRPRGRLERWVAGQVSTGTH
jgi:hypothetical protein